jgi:geranylgeranyl diphosphate synthase type I
MASVRPSLNAQFMVLSSTIQNTLQRHQHVINTALYAAFERANRGVEGPLAPFYGQLQYHLGQVDAQFAPIKNNPGKLMRPTLLLLAYEAAGAWGLANNVTPASEYLQRALPAAVAIELTHNFTLIHDDIEDGDTERRHRPTVWKVWGVPQAINAGDALFSLARLTLWDVLAKGVESDIAAKLGELLDLSCLVLAEGQYLDISFEERQDISVTMYIDMIGRKTAALMECAAEMGARLGTRDREIIARLSSFGRAMGIAFQVRDDLLGVWATTAELGKTPVGDVYRRKKSLPVLHALQQADAQDQQTLRTIYQQDDALAKEQVGQVLAIFERTQTRTYCQEFLRRQCQAAYDALASVPRQTSPVSSRALDDMETLVHFVVGAA